MGSLDSTTPLAPSIEGFKPLDMEEFRKQAHQTIDFIVNYYNGVESRPVLPDVEPGYLRHLLPHSAPYTPQSYDSVLRELSETVLPGLTNWTSPNFFAYFPATISGAALNADLLASALNPVAFNWLASPAVTELETLVVDWLARLLQLPKCFHFCSTGGGVVQATTSEAMLCTLVTARDSILARLGRDKVTKLTAYASDQTHSTFTKACKIAGFDPENIRAIPTKRDAAFCLSPEALRKAMEEDVAAGLIPTYFCATVGTTSSTAVDPVGPLADVAREFGAWVHVDAAYAGSACICPEFRQYLDGLDRVDSISMSPHKWLLTGLDCCCLWVRDRTRLVESLNIDPEYLKNRATDTGEVIDYKDWQIGVGRKFRSLKLYMVIRSYGVANLQSHIRSDVRMAKSFEGMVLSDPRFEVVVPRRFALVCFRLRAAAAAGDRRETEVDTAERLNRRLLEKINEGGRVYMTHTSLGGVYVLRFAVGASLTEERHVEAAWEWIRTKADELLKKEEDAEEVPRLQ